MTAALGHELVLYGATGYTGRQAVAYLARRAGQLGLRWAIAGRDRGGLSALAASLPEPRPAVVVADAADAAALAALAADAAVVISCVGPHAPLGDRLPEQCVAAGTHYADLCGENDVIATRIARLDAPARAAGVKLIPACGYESVPFDLGVLGLDRAFRERDGSQLEDVAVEVRFAIQGNPLRFGHGNSGGTLVTVARLAEAGDLTDVERFARAAGAAGSRQPAPALDLDARRSSDGGWLAPLTPTPFLNPAVIRLTSVQLADGGAGYSPALVYREALDMSASLGSPLLGALAAKGSSAVLRRLAAISRGRRTMGDRATLRLLQVLAPKPGNGPAPDSLDAIDYRIDLRARSTSGLRAEAVVTGAGHPGYRSAPNILAEAGIALARDRALPQRSGVLTPASGLGTQAIAGLAAAGLSFGFSHPGVGEGEADGGRGVQRGAQALGKLGG
jgi:short subunit dehydrogenase-like uncharacterized protein